MAKPKDLETWWCEDQMSIDDVINGESNDEPDRLDELSEFPWCSHCGRNPPLGVAGLVRDNVAHRLCHPDDQTKPDCYRLVTVWRHPLDGCHICGFDHVPSGLP